MGIDGRFFRILLSMYKDIKACVNCSEGLSPPICCQKGVRQGCNLSPVLFSLFVNDLEDYLADSGYSGICLNNKNIRCLLYADDLIICSSDILSLQGLLCTLKSYCDINDLELNIDKTKTIVFRRGGRLASNEKWYFQDRLIENVNSYNYLGLKFSSKGVWTMAQENLSDAAKKSMFSLKRMFSQTINLPVAKYIQVFDAKVLPILMYGAELWGSDPHISLARVYYDFHKYIMGLPRHTPNIVPLGELGRPDFSCHTKIKVIRYWLRILKHNANRYTKLSYYEQFNLAENNIPSWGLRVKNILNSTGFGHVWINQGVANEENFLDSIKTRLYDIDAQNWFQSVSTMSSLRTYISLKTDKNAEPYTYLLHDLGARKTIARLRCGVIDIGVNNERKNHVIYDQRICKFCTLKEIDDEFHYIMTCPFASALRSKYLPRSFVEHPDKFKFNNLMSTDSYSLLKSIFIFVSKSYDLRKSAQTL